jgi:hypothetical protein
MQHSRAADSLSEKCSPYKSTTEVAPFVIGFVTDGSVLKPVVYPFSNGKIGEPLTEKDLRSGPLAVTGAWCGGFAVGVNRFANHHFYTIQVMPGAYVYIPIPH